MPGADSENKGGLLNKKPINKVVGGCTQRRNKLSPVGAPLQLVESHYGWAGVATLWALASIRVQKPEEQLTESRGDGDQLCGKVKL